MSARSLHKGNQRKEEIEEILKKIRSEVALNSKGMIKSISSSALNRKTPTDKENLNSNKKKRIIKIENEPTPEVDRNCQVCFSAKADSVYMECGHGGVCYDCATSMWKNNEECYLCREVKLIYYIKLLGN